ncbi:LuxR C-terminal-related transcriptional regulator [Streptomyces sp. NPDC004542]|uniref:LuxR C-terminal-related transcriptional regulator n=1 Tax=Streptomyces sp. NPDC004542 TaxID=3154281 RepID=UPI0033A403A8
MTEPSRHDWHLLGLDEFDARLYREVLRDPGAEPGGWAESLDVTDEQVGEGVRRLAGLNLLACEPAGPDVQRVRAVDPHLALRAVLRSRDEAFLRIAAMAESLAVEYDRGRLRSSPERLVEVVEGPAAHVRRLRELYAGAEEEVLGLDTPPYVVSAGDNTDAQGSAMARGVRFRTVYAVQGLESPERFEQALGMAARGERARILATVPFKLLIIDGRTAMMPLTDRESDNEFRTIVVHRSALTVALRTLFESLWRTGTPLGPKGAAERPGGGETVSEAEQRLLRLLAAGLKDEAIARQLGISLRTLRRRIADLQDRLGAAGRFQAGVQAARRGWI